jgi:hypothetical protein
MAASSPPIPAVCLVHVLAMAMAAAIAGREIRELFRARRA